MGNNTAAFSIGVTLCILSALLSVVGVNTQKKFHKKNEKIAPENRKPYVTAPLWWLGMFGVVSGAIFDFVSLGFAPQTVVAAFGAATLVINAWTAPFLLDERLNRCELFATFLIAAGATVAVVSAPHAAHTDTLEEIVDRFKALDFILYAVAVICLVLVALTLFCMQERLLKAGHPNYSPQIHALTIAAVAGIIGAQSLLFAKAVMLILRQAFDASEEHPFKSFESYLIIVSLVCCVLSQTHMLNMGLARFDAVICLPIFQVFWIVAGVVGGAIFYQEFAAMNAATTVSLVTGFVIIIVGIYLLSKLHDSPPLEASQISRRVASMSMSRHSMGPQLVGALLTPRGLDDSWYRVLEEQYQEDGRKSVDVGQMNRKFLLEPVAQTKRSRVVSMPASQYTPPDFVSTP